MMKCVSIAGTLCLFAGLCLSAQASTATFQIIADPFTGTWANFALSGDGTVLAANYGGEIYRWTAAGRFQDLGPGDPYSSSIGISRDGSTIISGYIGSDGYSNRRCGIQTAWLIWVIPQTVALKLAIAGALATE